MRIAIDASTCMKCHSCELACQASHPDNRRRIFVVETEQSAVPITCLRCTDAPCLRACISGAISMDSAKGIMVDASACIGCGGGIMACPFGAVNLYNGRAYQCDLCHGADTQHCVQACPTQSIRVDDDGFKNLSDAKRLRAAEDLDMTRAMKTLTELSSFADIDPPKEEMI